MSRDGGLSCNKKMAATEEAGFLQPELVEEESSEGRQAETSPCASKMVAVLLVLPGIVLYVYILYVVVSSLVFPGSLSPFLAPPAVSELENATTGEVGQRPMEDLCVNVMPATEFIKWAIVCMHP